MRIDLLGDFVADTHRERRARLVLLWFAMATGAILVLSRYWWAQPQNGGPPPRLEMELLICATPMIAAIMGWLGQNLRIWSWSFTAAGIFGAYYAVARVLEDDGTAWTRAFYQETMLRVHLPLAAFGIAALLNIGLISLLESKAPNWSRLKFALFLIPLWVFAVLLSL
ncbi:MAG: hypothetical protein P4M15_06530 [Alphaproteobacteria bacterium]|nr:hypothetical protein [Alphaproteobacteria bacterium]